MQILLFGIPNCDSCRKARKWLDSNDLQYIFHDVRVDGLTHDDVKKWLHCIAWNKLLNTRSTTWRQLAQETRSAVDEQSVVNLLVCNPTLVKRPVLEFNGTVTVGFSERSYSDRLL